jgi:hypothetical protein
MVYYLYIQGGKSDEQETNVQQVVAPTRQITYGLHGALSQKTATFKMIYVYP